MIAVLQLISLGMLVYFLLYCVATGVPLGVSLRRISWYAQRIGAPGERLRAAGGRGRRRRLA